jgi:ketosteroid isomerase-like protein
MSEENVAVIRRMLDRGEESTEASWEILEGILDDDVQWEVGALGIAGLTTFHGPDGVSEFYLRWLGPFEEWGYTTEELIDAGDSVVARMHQWGRGKGSGVSVDNRFWQVWTLDEGKVIRSTHHWDKTEALEAAGLSE